MIFPAGIELSLCRYRKYCNTLRKWVAKKPDRWLVLSDPRNVSLLFNCVLNIRIEGLIAASVINPKIKHFLFK